MRKDNRVSRADYESDDEDSLEMPEVGDIGLPKELEQYAELERIFYNNQIKTEFKYKAFSRLGKYQFTGNESGIMRTFMLLKTKPTSEDAAIYFHGTKYKDLPNLPLNGLKKLLETLNHSEAKPEIRAAALGLLLKIDKLKSAAASDMEKLTVDINKLYDSYKGLSPRSPLGVRPPPPSFAPPPLPREAAGPVKGRANTAPSSGNSPKSTEGQEGSQSVIQGRARPKAQVFSKGPIPAMLDRHRKRNPEQDQEPETPPSSPSPGSESPRNE